MNNDCLYCTENEKLHSLMIYICDMEATKLYLFRDQTYTGRCVLALNEHINQFYELSDDTAAALARDMKKLGLALDKAFSPAKVNYGYYSDKLPHVHCHVVPKYPDSPDFGSTFAMNAPTPRYLSEEEYAQVIGKIKAAL